MVDDEVLLEVFLDLLTVMYLPLDSRSIYRSMAQTRVGEAFPLSWSRLRAKDISPAALTM